MNWKRWKMGLLVACVTGLASAFVAGTIIPTMTLKEGVFVCVASIAKDMLLFLKDHPVEQVTDTVIKPL